MEVKPGYKQSEVGVIPEKWDVRRLTSLLEQPRSVRYGIVQPGKFDPRGCLMLRSQDYSQGWTGPDEMHRVNSQLEHQYKNARINRDDLVMTVVGAGIGQVVIAPAWLDGAILSRSTARIAVDENQASRAFVKASLESPVGKRQILDCQKEGAQPVVSCQDLAKFFIPYPPLSEQRKIAEALSDVDALLGGLDRLIAKKRDLKQAAMQQLLTGQTRLPGFHDEWRTGKLSSFVLSHNSGVYKKSELYGQGSNIVGVSDLYGIDCVDGQGFAQVPLSAAERAKHTLDTNDLLYGESSLVREGIARTVYVTERGAGTAFAWHTRRYSVNQSILLSSFLYYYLQVRRARKYMIDVCIQTAITGINTVAYFACPVLIPSISEQTAIAEVLTDMDAELWVLEQRREKTRALKQAMMQELLTGKTRLI